MKNYFDAMLELLRQYVEVSINNRAEIAKINSNADLSQIAKEKRVNEVKEKELQLTNDCIKQSDAIIEKIGAHLDDVNNNTVIPDMQAIFAYLTASGSKCNENVLLSYLKPYLGNLTAIKAIASVADNSNVGLASKQIINSYIYDVASVKQEIQSEMELVFVGSKSATMAGKRLQKIAEKLGVEIVSDIKDEYTDNQLLRKAVGLA